MKSDFYDGEEQAPQMFPGYSEGGLADFMMTGILAGKLLQYIPGKIRIEEDQERKQPGYIYVGMSVSVFTERGQAMATLPSHVISDSFVPDESTRQGVFFFHGGWRPDRKKHISISWRETRSSEGFRFLNILFCYG